MIEVYSKEDLPFMDPPAMAFVRNEGIFYYCFAEGWRKIDNSFTISDIQKIPQESFESIMEATSYDAMVRYHYGMTNPLLAEVNAHNYPSGSILIDGGKMFCIQDQTKPVSWMGYDLHQIGVEVLKEGTPGIHIQNAQYRRDFHSWHSESIGFAVCKATPKGATEIQCFTCPPSVATKVNAECKQMKYTTPRLDPGPCISNPAWYDEPGIPYRYSNEMWLSSPWNYIDIPLASASDIGGSWPEGLSRTLTFVDPIPTPTSSGTCFYTGPSDMFLNKPKRGFGWILEGNFMGTVGQTSIQARMQVGPSEATSGPHPLGTTNISLYDPTLLPSGKSRFSRLQGITVGDYVCFESDPTRTIHKVVDVREHATYSPTCISIRPGLKAPLTKDGGYDQLGNTASNECYWISARTSDLTYRCLGWKDPDDLTTIPLYVKAVKGKTIELLSPLPADLPAGTKLPMWSSVENETMTYAYRDPSTYIHNHAFNQRREQILPQIEEHNAALDAEEKILGTYKGAAYNNAKARWFTPPYSVNSDLNEWFPSGLPYSTFHEGYKSIASRRIVAPKYKSGDVEYISLLNYRKI